MAKEPKKFRSALEYHGARLIVAVLSALPLSTAAWTGRRLGDLVRLLDGRHRRRALDQVKDRLGIEGGAARDFVRRNFRHYGTNLAEFAHLGRMHADDIRRHVDFGDLEERIRGLLAEGRGLIFITSHFGNWEWSNALARTLGVEGGSIARPLDNVRVNEFVRGIRERNGLRILDKEGAIRKALRMLRNNQIVGILIDQDAGRNGMMSPFLGKPASTITIPVELAIRAGSPMLAVGLRRGGSAAGRRFTVLTGPEVRRALPDADPAAETRRLLDTLNADLEGIIKQAPEQWFWIHRRWKSAGRE